MKKMDSPEYRAQCQNTLSEQKRSGKSVTAFCAERGIASSTFYGRKRKLHDRGKSGFVPIVVRPEMKFRIISTDGAEIEFSGTPDVVWLADFVRKLAA